MTAETAGGMTQDMWWDWDLVMGHIIFKFGHKTPLHWVTP